MPGGGIEEDEDHRLAAEREALEETGCEVKIEGGCLATSGMPVLFACVLACYPLLLTDFTEEWRNDLHQISYCYVARMIKDTGTPDLTELEKSEGLFHQWCSVAEAVELMESAKPTSELGKYIKERDLFFVNEFLKA